MFVLVVTWSAEDGTQYNSAYGPFDSYLSAEYNGNKLSAREDYFHHETLALGNVCNVQK